VPLPDHRYNGIALPALPFLTASRSGSPIDDATMMRMMLGQRRASSAQPFFSRSWTMPGPSALARDNSPLPDPDMSLFDPSFLDGANFGFPAAPASTEPFVC
jgi:transcription factor SOX7/8/10/18 (SOX group E/F)